MIMSLAYSERAGGGRDAVSKPRRFWQMIERTLETYSLQRTKRAVTEKTFRRCNVELARYRRLALKHDLARHDTGGASLAPRKISARAGR
jgi:hypothetical protein